MSGKLEGTFVAGGLLEGPLPENPGAEQRLREWHKLMQSAGLAFSLEIENGSFSLLAHEDPAPVRALSGPLAEVVKSGLEQLLPLFSEHARSQISSTLRTTEFRHGTELQTVYALRQGKVEMQSRVVAAETFAPTPPLSGRQRTVRALVGLAIAASGLFAASFFVNFRTLFHQAVEAVTPLDAEKLALDASAFKSYLVAGPLEKTRDGQALVLHLKRAEKYPLKESDFQAALSQNPALSNRLALEAIAKGYLRCELFTENGFLEYQMLRVRDLNEKSEISVAIPLPSSPFKISALRLSY